MKIKEIIAALEQLAPPILQESYDNCGLITGNAAEEITGILVCLDSTEEVIDEAIEHRCNLIIAHHPIVFSGLKKITGKNYVERVVIKAIKNDIAIYALHTSLDNVYEGVNKMISSRMGLQNLKILREAKGQLLKLVTFAPSESADAVRNALFSSGAGTISQYSECSFNLDGTGTFRPGPGTDPYSGKKDVLNFTQETRIEVVLETHRLNAAVKAMIAVHPYEEVAYDIYPVLNSYQYTGSGMVGDLPHPMKTEDFLKSLKNTFLTPCVRHTRQVSKMVSRIAVCGGSGSFLLPDAIQQGADVFITSDFKYHQFFDADGKIVIADIGHYESEQFTGTLIADFLKDKFPTFAVRLTKVNTNPVNYL
jgi:dinuclear metal center YbgI/SA1388 family protein